MILRYYTIFCLAFISINITQQTSSEAEVTEQLYKRLLQRQRAEQLAAIKSFQKVKSYEKQYEMIMLMAEKVFTIIQESRAVIESSPFIPGVSDFPLDDKIRDALSNILENTALFSEIILRFPDISVSVLKTNNNWDILLQWGIAYSYHVKYLLDNSTIKLLHLVSQELNHIPREPDYVNPYRRISRETEEQIEAQRVAKKKKKKPIKKGPRLSSHDEF